MNALHSIVVELAEKAGISPEDFDAHHTHRLRWFLDQDLLSTGDSDPSFVERVATKELREFIAVPEAFPGIFEPPRREE